MIIPAAAFIEAAIDQLKSPDVPAEKLVKQQAELQSVLGDNYDPKFGAGYELGLQTMRVIVSGMPLAVENKVQL